MKTAFREMIAHRTDGPLTSFVLISRAMKLASMPQTSAEDVDEITNALYEELEERGWVASEDIQEETGS